MVDPVVVEYLKNKIVRTNELLIKHQLYDSFYVNAALSIEFLGAFIDNKPLRARQQSKIRFDNAIEELFPPAYQIMNRNDWFYNKFRNHVVHSFLSSSYLKLSHAAADPEKHHLKRKANTTILIAELFAKDIEQALALLIEGFQKEKYKTKRMDGM